MKTAKFLLCTLALIFSLSAFNQVKAQTTEKPDAILIADETTLEYTKTGRLKIVSHNQQISQHLITHYYNQQTLTYSFCFKKDRNGKYPQWTIQLPAEEKTNILKTFSGQQKVTRTSK